jgi:hypothetical protein
MPKLRLSVLAGLLLLALTVHGGLYWSQRNILERRDFSSIPDFTARVGYCMASSLTPNEKITLAESIARPPDQVLFSRVMSAALSGEITPEKLSANRALLERDELRARSFRALSGVADRCGYNDPKNAVEYSLEELAIKWLEHDPAFVSVLESVRRRPPDAAARFNLVVEQTARMAENAAVKGGVRPQ